MPPQKGQSGRFQFIYLPMPLCLRESDSFGTHWMLQPTIEINLGSDKSRTLKGPEMVKLLRVMHAPGQTGALSADAGTVLNYAVSDSRWRKGARELGLIHK